LEILLFWGVTLSHLSIELLPDVTEPTLLISTEYIGTPATDVEYDDRNYSSTLNLLSDS
jgi:multidrug efflux pump subunit AcrB